MSNSQESWSGLLLVIAVHALALGAFIWSPVTRNNELVLPTIQGVIIPAPAAETVQVPSAKKPPPPKERPPEVEKSTPKPKKLPPKPKPKPQPPLVKAPPSEKAITREEVVEEEAAPPPPPKPVSTPAEKEDDTLGAPVIPPRQDANPLNNPAPAYPTISRRMREQGVVVLEVLILPDGRVGEVRVKESSGYKRLDETAIKAVKDWKYIPARRGDETIAYWYLQPLEFSLH